MSQHELVNLQQDESIIAELANAGLVGIDTEFMREKTFFAELCLIQLSIGRHIFCADPLGAPDLGPFWDALLRSQWVVHSGRQDMEVIFQSAGRLPPWVFDTQVAAALLGHAPQLGYAGMVSELFGVELDKSHTRADWSRRPLSAEVLRYAAEDVEYLLPAFDMLNERLDKVGRRSWAIEDSTDLLDRSLYDTDPGLAIQRLKAASNLRGAARSVASALATWREREALRRNRPRQWILRDAVLLELAQARPVSRAALQAIPGLAERTASRAGDELLDLIASATRNIGEYAPPPRPDEHQKAVLREMQKQVAACAAELGISAEVVAPKKELVAALNGDLDSRVFRGWRRQAIGDRLVAILDSNK
jgi:ribonuclease D